MDGRLRLDQLANRLTRKQSANLGFVISLDDEVGIELWMADLDILHPQELPDLAEVPTMDLKPEPILG